MIFDLNVCKLRCLRTQYAGPFEQNFHQGLLSMPNYQQSFTPQNNLSPPIFGIQPNLRKPSTPPPRSEDESDISKSISPGTRTWLRQRSVSRSPSRLTRRSSSSPQMRMEKKSHQNIKSNQKPKKRHQQKSGNTKEHLTKFGVRDVINQEKTTFYQYDPSKIKSNESILNQVNEIIKSCVELKENKKVSGDNLNKTNLIIEKAKEKEEKIRRKIDKRISSNKPSLNLEEGELSDTEMEADLKRSELSISAEPETNRTVQIIRKNDAQRRRSLSRSRSPVRKRSESRSPSRGRSRSPSRSRSRSTSRGRSSSRGRRPRRSWRSRERRRSESRERQRGRGRGHYMVTRSRSRSRDTRGNQVNKRSHWIAVSPCVIMDNITLEKVSKRPISVVQKDQYYFPSNAGFDVKITKWTGQDHIGGVHISQQVVKVEEKRDLDILVENPYDDRTLKLEKLDKIACLSVFSVPIPRFSNSMSPER